MRARTLVFLGLAGILAWNWLTGGEDRRRVGAEDAEAVLSPLLSQDSDAPAEAEPSVSVSLADRLFICRATIAELMGRPVGIIKAEEREGIIRTSYVRPDDGTPWAQACRVEDGRRDGAIVEGEAEWASVEDGRVRRWRDHPDDERTIYRLSNDAVEIELTYADGSGTAETFLRD